MINNKSFALDTKCSTHQYCFSIGGKKSHTMSVYQTEKSRCLDTLAATPDRNQGGVAIMNVFDYAAYNQEKNAQYMPKIEDTETSPTVVAKGPSAVEVEGFIRKYTPTECARLQGMPDWWCDGARANNTDTAEYKMWGNGMALPNILYVLERILDEDEKIYL